jgi:hypothetical protein
MVETLPTAQRYFVWVRLVRHETAAEIAVGKLEVLPPKEPPLLLAGPRPPHPKSAIKPKAPEEAVPGVFGLDGWYGGLDGASTSVDLGPAFDDEGDARKWAGEPAGLKWVGDAENYFLLSFQSGAPAGVQKREPPQTTEVGRGESTFPEADWDPVLLETLKRQEPAATVLDVTITLADPSYFGSSIDEQMREVDYLKTRRAARRQDIDAEAQGLNQVTYRMFQVLGLSTDDPANAALKDLREKVLELALPAVWHNKLRNPQQPRPRHLVPGLAPDFERPHWLYAGHPSFPGGHAAVAYLWAYLLACLVPKARDELLAEAERIAANRVIAGLHFPRDSAGGEALGKQIAEVLLGQIDEPSLGPALKAIREGSAAVRKLSASL